MVRTDGSLGQQRLLERQPNSGVVQKKAGSSLEERCSRALLEGVYNSHIRGGRERSPGRGVWKSLTMFKTFWTIPEAAKNEERAQTSEPGSLGWELCNLG